MVGSMLAGERIITTCLLNITPTHPEDHRPIEPFLPMANVTSFPTTRLLSVARPADMGISLIKIWARSSPVASRVVCGG